MLNIEKCEGLWIGSDKHRQNDCNLQGIKWPKEPIRCLGVYIGHDKAQIDKCNWSNRIELIKRF